MIYLLLLTFSMIYFFREHFLEPIFEGKTFQDAALDIFIHLDAIQELRTQDLK